MIDHKDIMELRDEATNADRVNRDDAISDMKFMAGDQWTEVERQAREATRRPVITVNRMPQFVQQVTGDMRQNSVSIEAVPVGGEDTEIADIYDGLIRQIEYRTGARMAYARSFQDAVTCGIGHFRIATEYVKDSVYDQDVLIQRITDPMAVLWDAGAVELDRSDAKHCFVDSMITEREFKKKYPDQPLSGLGTEADLYSSHYLMPGGFVRISEFWHREPYKRKLAAFDTGQVYDVTGMSRDQMQFIGNVVKEREVEDFKITRSIVGGGAVLKKQSAWAGSMIPIIPVIGSETFIEGQSIRSGLIRAAKDPQRMYNYWRSTAAEYMGTQLRSQYLVTPAMIKGFENQWKAANRSPRPYLPYNPDPSAPTLGPKREAPPSAPTAMWQETAILADEMKAVTGLHDASLGARSNETSGKAIVARQQEGDVANFHFHDNFRYSLERAGKILVDLIPKIYDGERVIRLRDDKSKDKFVQINALMPDGTYANDLSVGRFDVRTKVGASFTTQREKAADLMSSLISAQPDFMSIFGDKMFENLDTLKDNDVIADRIRKMNPEIMGDPDDAENPQPQQPDPMQQQAIELEMRAAEAKIAESEAKATKTEAEAQGIMFENEFTQAGLSGLV